MEQDHPELLAALRRMDLVADNESPAFVPLTGGVSSDIWRVDLARGPICVKRALAQLRVAAEWRAPVERNASEVAWIEAARRVVPSCAPKILGHDPDAGLFAMEYFDPERYRLWKNELRDGRVVISDAAAVGDTLGRIHAASAADPECAEKFANDRIFHDIRLEPYLVATGKAHPDLADTFARLVQVTAETRHVMVHGDVSPKNILIGPEGPVFLDAECAWYGDPAFDLAFCLNHLLLKCLWVPSSSVLLLDSFGVLAARYLARVDWEDPSELDARTARLLPGLLLARIDGKSPVEYLTDEKDRNTVRNAARAMLYGPVESLGEIRACWREVLRK
ncbi:MAG: aminoglycoside phosphotransferase family protein [Alphaproteobacteria bacterium]